MSNNVWCWECADGLEAVITFWAEDESVEHTHVDLPNLAVAHLQGAQQCALTDVLPDPLYQFLHNRLNLQSPVVLHLCQKLSPKWQQFPWEYLTDQGRNLHTCLMVVRFSPQPGATTQHSAPVIQQTETLCINLLPEADLPNNMYEHHTIRWEDAKALNNHPLDALNMLIVLAHGSEDAAHLPLLDEHNTPYELPNRALPDCVILLVCGNANGNMITYAKTLLDRGVNTVMAAVGQLNAEQAMAFCAKFYPRWLQGERLDTLLYQARQDPQQYHGAQRLQLLGEGALRHPQTPLPVSEQTDAVLKQQALAFTHQESPNPSAFVALLSRISQHCANDKNSPLSLLYKQLDITWDNEQQQRDLLNILHQTTTQNALPILTQHWVISLMTLLAEQYNHQLLAYCQQAQQNLPADLPAIPTYLYWWAHREYRLGNYRRALQHLTKGLNQITQDNDPALTQIYGLWLNCAIDLHLPNTCEWLVDQLDALLEYNDNLQPNYRDYEVFKRLDGKARTQIRCGNLPAALALFQNKKQRGEDYRYADSGPRELAWLLYTGSWMQDMHENTQTYAAAVRVLLNDYIQREPRNWGAGNENILYLFRALCLWSWRTGDHAAICCIEDFLSATAHFEMPHDPGPLGLATTFLILSGRTDMDNQWAERATSMHEYKYHLELAALYKLLGHSQDAVRQLNRFYSLRNNALMFELSAHYQELQNALNADTHHQEEELAVMQKTDYANSNALVKALLNNGLLPL